MSEIQRAAAVAIISVAVVILMLTIIYFVALRVYYSIVFAKTEKLKIGNYDMMESEQYRPYSKIIKDGVTYMESVDFEDINIEANDGITLFGRYYENNPKGPLVLFFHGYRGSAFRDGSGIFAICKRKGYNILLADQRAHGRSGGKTTTLGIKERFDCLKWIEYAVNRWGEEKEIILTGMSMGASTVLMASAFETNANIKGIISDCGFSSSKEILKSVMKTVGVPVKPAYRVAYRTAKVFGKFDMEEYSPIEAMEKCRFPVLFIHGDDDRFVPCDMSRQCYDACVAEKEIVFIKSAGHGLSHCVDAEKYEDAIDRFCDKYICKNY